MNVISLDNLSKSFGATPAVHDLSLDVNAGEACCLFGPSGCGKTTTLRLVAGLEQPDHGTVALSGTIVSGKGHFAAPRARGVGMVFQDLALWPHMNARRQIEFVLKGTARSRVARRSRAEELIAAVGLDGLAGKYPAEMSGGQQQRLAVARALANDPRVLLLDEPFANLDRAAADAIIDYLRAYVLDEGIAALIATHDRQDVERLQARVIDMTLSRESPAN